MQQQQENPMQQIVYAIWDHFLEVGHDTPEKEFFHKIRVALNHPKHFNMDVFKEILETATKEWDQALLRSEYQLHRAEGECKEALVKVIKNVEPTGPDDTRRLVSIIKDLNGTHEAQYIRGIKDALEYADDDLKAECLATWPGDLGEDEDA